MLTVNVDDEGARAAWRALPRECQGSELGAGVLSAQAVVQIFYVHARFFSDEILLLLLLEKIMHACMHSGAAAGCCSAFITFFVRLHATPAMIFLCVKKHHTKTFFSVMLLSCGMG